MDISFQKTCQVKASSYCESLQSILRTSVTRHLMEDHGVPENETNALIKSKLRLRNRAIGGTHKCPRCDYKSPSKFTLKNHIGKAVIFFYLRFHCKKLYT